MEMWFLPGVPVQHVLERLGKAGGDEVGRLGSPVSSAALAVNAFGWFIERPDRLPAFPGLPLDRPVEQVEVEVTARFPWSGGRHPWLDALVETPTTIIGVESKRYEPFRDRKTVAFSEKYSAQNWGDHMAPYVALLKGQVDGLRAGAVTYEHLDVAQLLKHAFGLVTEAGKRNKAAVLVYLFAEPEGSRAPSPEKLAGHRADIARFSTAVAGAAVGFHALSYREWLASWPGEPDLASHAALLKDRFAP